MRTRTIFVGALALGATLPIGVVGAKPSQDDPPAHVNLAPHCEEFTAGTTELWPPNHKFRPVQLPTAVDPEGEALGASSVSVLQDEPLNALGDGNTEPDAIGSLEFLMVRAERSGTRDGRVYHISVTYTDEDGLSVACTNTVVVPHDQSPHKTTGDDGPLYNSFS